MAATEVKIGELANPEQGSFKIGPFGSSLKKDELVTNGISVAGIENVLPNAFVSSFRKFITDEKFKQLSQYEIKAGDIVVTTMGTIGRAAVVPKNISKTIIDSHLFRMRIDQSKVYPVYLCYAINGYTGLKLQLEKMSRGAIMEGLNTTILKECKIPLPPIAEQERIAAICAKADRLRRTRRYAIELSDTYLRSVFLEMFGDPATNSKSLEIQSLGKHLAFMTSGSRGYAEYYSSSGDRFIRSLDVQMNHISDTDIVYVTPPDNAESKRTQVRPNDVLLTVTGSRIGRVATVPAKIGKAYVSQHVAILRLSTSLNPIFLSMFLSLKEGGQEQISRTQYGQTKPGLNFEQIQGFKIPISPLPLQEKFAQIVQKHERIRAQQREALRQAEHLFQTILHQAFRGEL
ncbi:restriction endonuclease subunit S [Pseudanabaena sp. PCC 6802]|uniref:restriction endonuclease subunit S n=1 Tax=Pseudanabaena sp. PCC 6802 TaxID=118173 RepID=UPI00034B0301|nr:restriction endonuclease subunit S [Pseudanabaena sp. PCC 6802]